MATRDNPSITIAVCTVRPAKCLDMLRSLAPHLRQADQVVVVVDGRMFDVDSHLHIFVASIRQAELLVMEENVGLSRCRSIAMDKAIHNHLVFFDDDVIHWQNTLDRYRYWFALGKHVVGGPLQLPPHFGDLPRWLPEGYSSLLGIHLDTCKIWGGNFGFDVQFATQCGAGFRLELGRKGNGLQSGDDTTFISDVQRCGGIVVFDPEMSVFHDIDRLRVRMPYLIKRSFWQGRSESRRQSIFSGLAKEMSRAYGQASMKQGLACLLLQVATGTVLFVACFAGVLVELPFKKKLLVLPPGQ